MSPHVVKLNDKLLNVKVATATTIADVFVISLLQRVVFSKRPAKPIMYPKPGDGRSSVNRPRSALWIQQKSVAAMSVRARARRTDRRSRSRALMISALVTLGRHKRP